MALLSDHPVRFADWSARPPCCDLAGSCHGGFVFRAAGWRSCRLPDGAVGHAVGPELRGYVEMTGPRAARCGGAALADLTLAAGHAKELPFRQLLRPAGIIFVPPVARAVTVTKDAFPTVRVTQKSWESICGAALRPTVDVDDVHVVAEGAPGHSRECSCRDRVLSLSSRRRISSIEC